MKQLHAILLAVIGAVFMVGGHWSFARQGVVAVSQPGNGSLTCSEKPGGNTLAGYLPSR